MALCDRLLALPGWLALHARPALFKWPVLPGWLPVNARLALPNRPTLPNRLPLHGPRLGTPTNLPRLARRT